MNHTETAKAAFTNDPIPHSSVQSIPLAPLTPCTAEPEPETQLPFRFLCLQLLFNEKWPLLNNLNCTFNFFFLTLWMRELEIVTLSYSHGVTTSLYSDLHSGRHVVINFYANRTYLILGVPCSLFSWIIISFWERFLLISPLQHCSTLYFVFESLPQTIQHAEHRAKQMLPLKRKPMSPKSRP